MSEQELNDLADDIRETSLFDPITLYEGKILDGKCRYITYFRAGVEPRYENINSTYNEYEEAYKLEFIMGVLNALYEDLKKNYLKNISELIHTEVFSNFLEMAIKK